MRKIALSLALLALSAVAAPAQDASFNSGIKLRGNFHFNRSAVNSEDPRVPEAENGYGAGLEIIGRHLGVALYGFTVGNAREFDADATPVMVVAELNYFWPIQSIRLAPYAGIHTGLGVFTKDYFNEPFVPKPQDGISGLGYQIGLRFKPIPVIGLDAQWRRMSVSAFEAHGEMLERNQILIGLTLF